MDGDVLDLHNRHPGENLMQEIPTSFEPLALRRRHAAPYIRRIVHAIVRLGASVSAYCHWKTCP